MVATNKQLTGESNRRAARRYTVCSFAKIECRKGSYGFGANILRSVENLSETGICVQVKSALAKGEEVEILFSGLDSGQALKRMGRVVWSRGGAAGACCVGVQFQAPMPYTALLRIVRQS